MAGLLIDAAGRTGISIASTSPEVCIFIGHTAIKDRKRKLGQLAAQSKSKAYDVELLDRSAVQALFPDIQLGEQVEGAGFSAHDGHVNPLYLMRACHAGIVRHGDIYVPDHRVVDISRNGSTWTARTKHGDFETPRLVLAAGLGLTNLATKAGLKVPLIGSVDPILVTERTRPIFPYPMSESVKLPMARSCLA